MSDEETVSVAITTNYRSDRLCEAIQMRLAQRHEPTAILVVDGSGEADVRHVAEGHPVACFAHQEDRGALADRYPGAELSTGAYLQIFDDDRQHPEKIAAHLPLVDAGIGVRSTRGGTARGGGVARAGRGVIPLGRVRVGSP